MEHGILIIIDGPSASGKDSIIEQVLKDLKNLGIKSISIEETKEENYDRKKILEAKQHGDKEVAEAIISERKRIYETKIIPQLFTGNVVITNRGEPTTLTYQTIKNELSMEGVWNMHRQNNIPLPDLVVITNCSVKEAIKREQSRNSPEDKDKKFMSGKFTTDNRQPIHDNYKKVKTFLEQKRINVIYLDTDTMTIPEESQRIVGFIEKTTKKN
ncbi:MAG: hypothetical protein Q7R51_03125 [bacterium]|nr:hypothetical protein [bacterium]